MWFRNNSDGRRESRPHNSKSELGFARGMSQLFGAIFDVVAQLNDRTQRIIGFSREAKVVHRVRLENWIGRKPADLKAKVGGGVLDRDLVILHRLALLLVSSSLRLQL